MRIAGNRARAGPTPGYRLSAAFELAEKAARPGTDLDTISRQAVSFRPLLIHELRQKLQEA